MNTNLLKPFKNKTALITGGNSGIGLATAIAFAERGANTIITGRDEKQGKDAIEKISAFGNKAVFKKADVQDAAVIKDLLQYTKNDFGRLDFAVNNAGIVGPLKEHIVDLAEDDWEKIMGINLTGMFICMKYQLPLMIEQKSGVIINVASVAGLRAGLVNAAYTASKHGVIGLTRKAAVEYAKFGIRVNAVCPSVIETPMTIDTLLTQNPEMIKRVPLGRFGKPEEVAAVIIWLCMDASSYINGVALPIDGGVTA